MTTYKNKVAAADAELKPGECRTTDKNVLHLRCHVCGTNNAVAVKQPLAFKCVGCEHTFEIEIDS